MDDREAATPAGAKRLAMGLPKLCLLVLVALACVQLAYFYPLIVAHPMASHFSVSGAPNGWQTKEAFFTTAIVMLAMLTTVFFAIPALLGRLPASVINMPSKEYWLAPERREQTLRRFAERFQWLGATVLVFIIAIMQLVLQTNTTDRPRLPTEHNLIFFIYIALVFVQVAGLLIMFRRPRSVSN